MMSAMSPQLYLLEVLCSQDWSSAAWCCAMQAMGTIHGVLPDGRVITNVEVFRKLYEAVGLGRYLGTFKEHNVMTNIASSILMSL